MATAIALKLFNGQELDAPRTPREEKQQWTLREAFNQVTKPLLVRRGRASGSITKYEKAIWHWEAHWRLMNKLPADADIRFDPAIVEIEHEALDEFPVALLDNERSGIRTHTAANQQLMYVESILRSCGPRVGRKGGCGILDAAPIGERLVDEAPSRVRRRIPDDVLCSIYEACRFARFPVHPRLPAPAIWRTMLVAASNVGPRRCETWLLPMHSDFQQPECPDDSIEATSPSGWLQFHTPKTQRTKKGRALCVPVAPIVRQHLDALRDMDPRRGRIFPVGQTPSTWRKWFVRIQEKIGIQQPYTFQELRKTCSMRYRRHAGRDIAQFMLGQVPRGVNAKYYDDLAEDAVQAVQTITQPEAFLRVML